MRRLLVWLAMALAGWGVVVFLTWILDLVLWRISRDYIHAPNEFLRLGVRAGPVVGTFLAAVATTRNHPLPASRAVVKAFFVIWCCSVVAAIGVAGALAIASHFSTTVQTLERLLPVRREAFCMGLTYGYAIGLGLGVSCATRILVMSRRSRREPG
jgi:hypothetical protein